MVDIFIGILAYSIMALVLWLLAHEIAYPSDLRVSCPKTPLITQWPMVISIVLFGIFYGIRYDTGADNITYIEFFESLKRGVIQRDSLEIGYNVISHTFAFFDVHFSVFIGFWGALMLGLIYSTLKHEKKLLPYVALFIILGPFFLTMANTMRQCVALCFFAYSLQFVAEKKLGKYLSCIFIAFLFHKSALLLIPFYYLLRWMFIPKSQWCALIVFIAFTIVGNTPTWVENLNNLSEILMLLNYEDYANNLEQLAQSEWSIEWGPSRIGTWLLMASTITLFISISKKFTLPLKFELYFRCFYWGACFYNLMINTDQVFLRPFAYFYDFYIIIVPFCMYYLKSYKSILLSVSYLILACFYSIYMVIHGILSHSSFEVYKFFFLADYQL